MELVLTDIWPHFNLIYNSSESEAYKIIHVTIIYLQCSQRWPVCLQLFYIDRLGLTFHNGHAKEKRIFCVRKHQYIATRFYNGRVCLGANEFSRQTRFHSTLAMSDFTGSSWGCHKTNTHHYLQWLEAWINDHNPSQPYHNTHLKYL